MVVASWMMCRDSGAWIRGPDGCGSHGADGDGGAPVLGPEPGHAGCWTIRAAAAAKSNGGLRTDSILRGKAIKLAVRVLWTSAKIHTAPRRRRQLLKERELKTESIECGIDYHMLVLHPPPPPTVLRNSRCETSAIKLP